MRLEKGTGSYTIGAVAGIRLRLVFYLARSS